MANGLGTGPSEAETFWTEFQRDLKAEEILGAKLFDRMSDGLTPTMAGEVAIEFARRMQELVDDAGRSLSGTDSEIAGTIRLSVPHNVVPFGLAEDLCAFNRLYPDVYLQVNASDEPVSFLSRQVDVVIRAANEPPDGLWGFRLMTITFDFYLSDACLDTWQQAMRSDPENVPLPYIVMNDTDTWRDRDQLLRHFPSARAVAETNGIDSVLAMIRYGLGAGRLSDYVAAEYDDLSIIVRCDESCDRTLWILTHPDLRRTRRIKLFTEFLHARFQDRDRRHS